MKNIYLCRTVSLVVIVIVIVIIGIKSINGISGVRQGTEGALEASLHQDLDIIRESIDQYHTEHGGAWPKDSLTFTDQLTMYTDKQGNTSTTMTSAHIYGPYLLKMPHLPVGKNTGSSNIRDKGVLGIGKEGWYYDKDTGGIYANVSSDELDSKGVAYNSY